MLALRAEAVNDARVNRADVLGNFCGVPIVTIDELSAEADDARDLTTRLLTSSHTSVPPEILPGEELCSDGIIRRTTTAEAQGYDTYHNQEAIEAGKTRESVGMGKLALLDGKMVYFRPNRATMEVYAAGTQLPCLPSEPQPFVLINEGN